MAITCDYQSNALKKGYELQAAPKPKPCKLQTLLYASIIDGYKDFSLCLFGMLNFIRIAWPSHMLIVIAFIPTILWLKAVVVVISEVWVCSR